MTIAALHGTFVGVGVFPRVSKAEAVSARVVRVTFDRPMLANAALTTVGNYATAPQGPATARTLLTVVIESTTTVILTYNGDLSAGTPSYIITITGVADYIGNAIDVAHNTANLTVPPGMSTLPEYNSDGGEIVSFNLGLADGDYFVDVGTNPGVSSVRAYSGVPGNGNHCSSVGGILTFAVPHLVPAEFMQVKATPVLGGGSTTSGAIFNARRRPIFDATHQLRRMLPGKWEVGPSTPELEVVP